MVMEVYTAEQEWPISLPGEPPHDRWLEARDEEGAVSAQWFWNDIDGEWVGFGAPESFYDIVATCGRNHWSLQSLPRQAIRR